MGSHARFLQLQGQDAGDVDAVATLNLEGARLAHRERALLDYVRVLTLEPAGMTDEATRRLRDVGWSDEQIFETAFITALFAFFNRMADAYGLDYPSGGWLPPELRGSETAAAAPQAGGRDEAALPEDDPQPSPLSEQK